MSWLGLSGITLQCDPEQSLIKFEKFVGRGRGTRRQAEAPEVLLVRIGGFGGRLDGTGVPLPSDLGRPSWGPNCYRCSGASLPVTRWQRGMIHHGALLSPTFVRSSCSVHGWCCHVFSIFKRVIGRRELSFGLALVKRLIFGEVPCSGLTFRVAVDIFLVTVRITVSLKEHHHRNHL